MSGVVAAVLDVVQEILVQDYPLCFAPRFESASRVVDSERQLKKRIPYEPVEELRNAFDHLSRAMLLARAHEAGPNAPLPMIGKEQLNGDPFIDVVRARRHIVAGEYYSLYYTATERIREIEKLLQTELTKHVTDREEGFDRLDRCMEALSEIGVPRSTAGAQSLNEIEEEITRTEEIRDQLNDTVVLINQLWFYLATNAGYRLFEHS